MKKILMLRGLPASGKSTFAKAEVLKSSGQTKRVNKDDLRAMLDAGKWSRGNEKFILKVRDAIVKLALQEGHSIIVDDTNFSPDHEVRLLELAKEGMAGFEAQDFEITLDEAIKRDAARPNSVGADVIKRMYYQYVQKKPVLNKAGEHVIMCDLDGTLAEISHRSPYDASKCEEDGLKYNVARVLCAMPWMKRIFMSGRSSEFVGQTLGWLKKHELLRVGDELHMRAKGDSRKDSIVKLELFETMVNPKYTVDFVLDDRDQVVEMWRAIGLECWQVAPGNF